MNFINTKNKVFFLIVAFMVTVVIRAEASSRQDNETYVNNRMKFDYYFYSALNAKALGNYAEAVDLYKHCYALDSTNANVLVELGAFYGVLQEKNKALEFFKAAVRYDNNNYYYNMMLATLSKELGLKQDVVDIYERMLVIYPDKSELYFDIASAYADNGELEKAIDALNELETHIGVSEVLTLNKYRLYSMMDDEEKALAEIRRIIDENPNNPAYLVLMGEIHMASGRYDDAIEYLERAKQIDASHPAFIEGMINYYEKTNNKLAAQEELQNAITGASMDVDTKMQLLTRYLNILNETQQQLSSANALFDELIVQYPSNTQLRLFYGNVLMLQDNIVGAEEQYKLFIADNPQDPRGYEQMLRIVVPQEDWDRIIDVTTEALKYLPENPQFYFYLGGAYYQLEDYEKSLRTFEQAVENAVFANPSMEAEFHGRVGDVNYELGNKEKAFENYEKALKIDPQNLPVLNNYSYFLSLDKRDLDKAEQMSGITVKLDPLNPVFLDTYGWILYEQGSYVMSKIYIEKAIEHGKDNLSDVIYEHYGDVLYKTGDEEGAMEQWMKAKELGGNSKELEKKIETGKME